MSWRNLKEHGEGREYKETRVSAGQDQRRRGLFSGGRRGIRTHDPRIKNPLLCQLS